MRPMQSGQTPRRSGPRAPTASRSWTRTDDRSARHATVVTATIDESLEGVLAKMSAGRFRHVPVLEDGRLAGMISSGDAVKYRLDLLETEQSALREYIATA